MAIVIVELTLLGSVMLCVKVVGFMGHLTVLPIPFMMATSSIGSMLRLYSGTQVCLAEADKCSLGLVDGQSSGCWLSRAANILSTVE